MFPISISEEEEQSFWLEYDKLGGWENLASDKPKPLKREGPPLLLPLPEHQGKVVSLIEAKSKLKPKAKAKKKTIFQVSSLEDVRRPCHNKATLKWASEAFTKVFGKKASEGMENPPEWITEPPEEESKRLCPEVLYLDCKQGNFIHAAAIKVPYTPKNFRLVTTPGFYREKLGLRKLPTFVSVVKDDWIYLIFFLKQKVFIGVPRSPRLSSKMTVVSACGTVAPSGEENVEAFLSSSAIYGDPSEIWEVIDEIADEEMELVDADSSKKDGRSAVLNDSGSAKVATGLSVSYDWLLANLRRIAERTADFTGEADVVFQYPNAHHQDVRTYIIRHRGLVCNTFHVAETRGKGSNDHGGFSLKASRKFVCETMRELLRRKREGGPEASFEEFKEICLKNELPRLQKTFGSDIEKLRYFRERLEKRIERVWHEYPTWLKNRTSELGKRSGEVRRKKAIAEDYPKIVQTYHEIGNLKGTADKLTISCNKVRYALRWYESLSEAEKRKVLGDLYGKVQATPKKRKLESRQEDILAAMKAGWQNVMHIANEAKCHRSTVYRFIKNAPKRPDYDKIKDFLPKLKTRWTWTEKWKKFFEALKETKHITKASEAARIFSNAALYSLLDRVRDGKSYPEYRDLVRQFWNGERKEWRKTLRSKRKPLPEVA